MTIIRIAWKQINLKEITYKKNSVRRNHKIIKKNNRLKLKLQWKFRNKKQNVFTEELDKTTLIVKMIKQ